MAFPQAANVTYRVSKNTTFSVGRFAVGVNEQAQLGAFYVHGAQPTLVIGDGTADPTFLWVESFDVSPLERTGSETGTAGWFDNTDPRVNTLLATEGAACYEYRFPAGQTGSPDGGAVRHNLEMTKEVDFSFKLRLHPVFPASHINHLFYLFTNLDTGNGPPYSNPWVTPASNFCTAYLNLVEERLHLEFQANSSGVGWFTPPGGHAGSINDDAWHEVRAYYKLNTFTNGIPNADGVFRVWLDGTLVCENTAVQMVFEENVDPYFTQLMLGPYWNTSISGPSEQSSILVDHLRLSVPGTTPQEPGEPEPQEPVVVSGQFGRDDPFHRPPAGMTPLYVDGATGSDSNDGSLTRPWKTLQHAIPRLQPGQELRVRPTAVYVLNDASGSYTHGSVEPATSGTASAPIIVRGDPEYDTKPILRRTVGGVDNPPIGIHTKSHIWFMDLEIDANDLHSAAVQVRYSRDCRLIRCDIHSARVSNFDNCMPLRIEACSRIYVYGNDIHDSHNDGSNTNASAITLYGNKDCVFSYNDFYNCPSGAGIKDKTYGQQSSDLPSGVASQGHIVEHNRFRDTLRSGCEIHVQNSHDAVDYTIRYNLFKCSYGLDTTNSNSSAYDGIYGLDIHHNTFYAYSAYGLRPGMYGDDWRFHSNIFYAASDSVDDIRAGAPGEAIDELGWNAFRFAAQVMVDDWDGQWESARGTYISVDGTNLQNHTPAWNDAANDDFRLSPDSVLRSAGKAGTPVGAFGDTNAKHWAWWLPQQANELFDPAYDPPEADMTWYYVDIAAGDDANDGSAALPWKTLQHAIAQLDAPGKGLNIRPTGTYYLNNAPVNGSTQWQAPSVQPTAAGTAALPIVIRKDPAYSVKPKIRRSVNIDCFILGGNPPSFPQEYGHVAHWWFIELDIANEMPEGSATDAPFGLFYAEECRVIRCDVHHVRETNGNNPTGIRLENTHRCHVYANKVWDIGSHDGTWHWNISCIKQYSTSYAKIHHNELWDAYAGYIDKNAPQDRNDTKMSDPDLGSEQNEVYQNFIHDVEDGIVVLANGDEPAQDNRYHHNLIISQRHGISAETGSNADPADLTWRHSYYNNTVVGYTGSGIQTPLYGRDIEVYNNILIKSANTSSIVDIDSLDVDSDITRITKRSHNVFRYAARIETADGSSYAAGPGSLQNTDPLFVNAAGFDYRLQSASPCLGAADDGLAMGAFDPGDDWKWW